MAENIGIKVEKNKGKCSDRNCPFHGSLRCRGNIFVGTVISARMHRTAKIEWARQKFDKKYERYEKKRSRLMAHNPECINAKEGDVVKVSECRPLSKTKNFVIIELMGKERGFKERMESLEESKVKEKIKKEEEEDAAAESKDN